VITPSYNQGQFLEETLRSVLLQGYPNLEYIVIDGGSQDESRALLEKYAPFLSFWVSEKDQGQTHAINKGLRQATGAVMGWLNSDDLLLPDALNQIGRAFLRPQTQVVCGFRYFMSADSRLMQGWIRGLPHPHVVRHRNILAQETVYWRREVWEALGELDESLYFCMDYDYWQRMVAVGYRFRLLPHYLGAFRQHESSKSLTQERIHKRELALLYPRYGVGADESEALAALGTWWSLRYDLTKDLCHQAWFAEHPRVALAVLRLIESPFFSLPLLMAYDRYRRRRDKTL
jgi:glycosyltransferase involved in cell wall biosynthesis